MMDTPKGSASDNHLKEVNKSWRRSFQQSISNRVISSQNCFFLWHIFGLDNVDDSIGAWYVYRAVNL